VKGPTWPGLPLGSPAPALTIASLMSGTSLDGMDVVVVRLEDDGRRLHWEVIERVSESYPDALRESLLAALGGADVASLAQLHAEIGHAYAAVCGPLADRLPLDLVALSGQNVYHVPRIDPARGWRTRSTLQLGEAAYVLERCRVPVMADFRQSDVAAGGQGAPLVAYGDWRLHAVEGVARSVHNLGGISNLTYLPADGDPAGVIAFDTGPGTCLVDEAAMRCFGVPYDEGGALAARGRVDDAALNALLAHPYLALPYPKTTGRELFELERTLHGAGVQIDSYRGADLVALMTAFAAAAIAHAYHDTLGMPVDEVLLAGGGAMNPTLVEGLRHRLDVPIRTFEEVGMVSKEREALAFAVMAYDGFHGRATTLPAATGARRGVVAGKLLWPGARREEPHP
jgi:anhydro-N-acetylmuramic acid kinase